MTTLGPILKLTPDLISFKTTADNPKALAQALSYIEKYFSDDERQDYPLLKRFYFKILSFVNKILNTGEAVLLVFKMQ